MKRDDELGRELLAAYRRRRPGEDFDRKVMQRISDGGGEGEISAVVPGGWRTVAKALAAAVLLVAVAWAISWTFGGADPDALPSGAGPAAGARDLAVDVDERGGYHVGDRDVSPAELASFLETNAASDLDLLVRARPDTLWGPVLDALRTATRARIRALRIGAPGGEPASVTAIDEGRPDACSLILKRSKQASTVLAEPESGLQVSLDQVLPALVVTLKGIGESGVPMAVEVHAAEDVPFADVLRVVRAAVDGGISPIRVGDPSSVAPPAPPPNVQLPPDLLKPEDVQIAPLTEEVRPDVDDTKADGEDGKVIEDPVVRDAPAKERGGSMRVELRRRDEAVEVKAAGKWLPLEKGLAALEPEIRAFSRRHASSAAEVEASAGVPDGAVERVSAFLKGCGIEGVTVVTPEGGSRRER